jgi:hypothetical protein
MLKSFGIQIWKLYKDIKEEVNEIISSIKSLAWFILWETLSLLFDIFKQITGLISSLFNFIRRGF